MANQSPNPLYYLAYGSNLHPVRLRERVPSAQLVGVIELSQHRLAFHKKGRDGSSKCDLVCTHRGADILYGAIYQIAADHKLVLDHYEGKGNGYLECQMRVELDSKEVWCFTYFAESSHIVSGLKPYHWYKNLVLLGASHLQFPEAYLTSIESVESVEDPDEARRKRHGRLIEEIVNYQSV